MLWYSLKVLLMSTHNICFFCGEIRKIILGCLSYLELCSLSLQQCSQIFVSWQVSVPRSHDHMRCLSQVWSVDMGTATRPNIYRQIMLTLGMQNKLRCCTFSNWQPIRLLDLGCWYKFRYWMTSSEDPDQLASSEANWSGSTLFANAGYIRVSAGQGLMQCM